MSFRHVVAAAFVSAVSVSAHAVPVPLSAKVAEAQTTAGNGLSGRFYDRDISDPVGVHSTIYSDTPDGTFISSRVDYAQGDDTDGVVSFLGDDGETFVGTDPGNFTGSVLTFDGFINITDEMDFNEDIEGIQVFFALASDDGFSLKIGGEQIGSAGVRSYSGTLLPTEFAASGLYSFSLLYFENGGQNGLSFGFASEGVNPLDGDAFFRSVPTSDVPEPAMLGLFGLGAFGLAAARRRR